MLVRRCELILKDRHPPRRACRVQLRYVGVQNVVQNTMLRQAASRTLRTTQFVRTPLTTIVPMPTPTRLRCVARSAPGAGN